MSHRRHSGRGALRTRASVFAALGDETRLSVLAKLCNGSPQSISRLTLGTSLSRQAVTKHLQVLANVGLACNSRLGRESVWELAPKPLEAARQSLESISAQWDAALDRLRKFVEG